MVVNNTLSFQSIPPGVIEDTPAGKRQRYFHDFFNYAGLHRTVWLYSTPHSYLDDVTVVTGLDGASGTVDYQVQPVDPDGLQVAVVLRDADGGEVATGRGASGTLTVADVHRWAPATATSTSSRSQLVDDAGDVVDSYRQSVGVRTVEVDGIRFLINGEPFHFTGFGKHEDLTVIGKGHNDAIPRARLRAARLDRRELLPHLALPVLRGRPGLRRPPRHRDHRRDRRRRA